MNRSKIYCIQTLYFSIKRKKKKKNPLTSKFFFLILLRNMYAKFKIDFLNILYLKFFLVPYKKQDKRKHSTIIWF